MSVITFPVKNAAINPDVVLDKAKGEYESLCIIGWSKDGIIDFRASLNLNHAQLNWLLGVVQHKLQNGDYAP